MCLDHVNDLFLSLQEQMKEEDVETFKGLLEDSPIPPATLEKLKTVIRICQELVRMKEIRPEEKDGFKLLKDRLGKMKKKLLVDKINQYEAKQAQQVVRPQQVVQPQQAAATAQGQNQQDPQDPSTRPPPEHMYN